ncbi:MAG: radical SAM protein [Lachnospiraceae bacterium]|nr:radical SAM protein [Lachnospiraceae bacterium]MCI9665574.1 radical SAM protein [Lachnospiraceae bacterium]
MLSSCVVSTKLKDGMLAVYNSIFCDPVFMSSEEFITVSDGKITSDMYGILKRKGILVDDEQDDLYRIDFVREKVRDKIGTINFVIMMMSDFCNLSCDYCIEKQYNIVEGKCMTNDVIDGFFQMVSSGLINLASNVEFILYGGEPLLNLNGIKYFLDRKEIALPESKCSIVTNAILLDEELVYFFKERKVNVGISIDGPKEITDCHRKYKKGNGSVYDDVQKNLSYLCESGVEWSLSITVTDELMNKKDRFFKWIGEVRPRTVAFNLLKLSFAPTEATIATDYYKDASYFLVEAHMKLQEMKITERDITRKIGYFLEHQPVVSDCAAASLNQLTINTNGDIHACQCYMNQMNTFGSVFDKTSYTIPMTSLKMFENLPINRAPCLKCNALPICGGGCLVQGKTVYCNDKYLDEGYCEYAKNIMTWIFQRLYDSFRGDIPLEGR